MSAQVGAACADPKVGTTRASKSKARKKATSKAKNVIAEVSPRTLVNTPPGLPGRPKTKAKPKKARGSAESLSPPREDERFPGPHLQHKPAPEPGHEDSDDSSNGQPPSCPDRQSWNSRRLAPRAKASARGAVARVARAPIPGLLITAALLATCPGQTESLQLPRYSQVGFEATGLGLCSSPVHRFMYCYN